MGLLSSLNILDFSTLLPGPYATMMLADMGAQVLRVEAPDRMDAVQARPPFEDGLSVAHMQLNRSKRSMSLNLKCPGADEVVKRLVQHYDIVVEQFRPGVMERLGISYEVLAEANPRLIYCALTGYGQTGPLTARAGHDNNYLALAGVMSHSGRKEHGPWPQGVQVADVGAGSQGLIIGMLAAVLHREQTGEGQLVDVSMFDGAIAWNAFAAAEYLASGRVPDYESMILNGGTHYGYYRTRDGRYLSVGSLEPKFWLVFCDAIERPDLKDQLSLPGPAMEKVKEAIRETIGLKDYDAWKAIFAQCDVCVEPVLTLEETFEHPQTLARDMVVEVPKANGTSQRQVGFPIKFSKVKPEYAHVGVEPGIHTEEVLLAAGYSDDDVAAMRAAGMLGT